MHAQEVPRLSPQELQIPLPLDEIAALCRQRGVEKLAMFGSILRDDFRPDSDVDVLVSFLPGAEQPWWGHFQDLEADLSRVVGRTVELVDWDAVEKSPNWIRRHSILGSARLVYEA